MTAVHKTVSDYIPIAKSTTEPAFASRFNHPFLFGREVLEEEFRFSTVVTADPAHDSSRASTTAPGMGMGNRMDDGPPSISGETLKIRHWVIMLKKPPAAAAQDRIFLGRGETNDICVPHKTVSKLHAYFQRDAVVTTKWQVVDTGSANGTKHNGMVIPPRAKVTLVDGDTICFGRCVFQWMTARSLYERLIAMKSD